MSKNKGLSLIGLVLIAAVIVASSFQNCAKVNYQTTANPVGAASVTKTATINPAFSPQNADLKVLFVVDDSYTMSQSQSRLSNALDSLLNPLQGRNVEFKIVSTSGIPDNLIDYSIQSTNLSSTVVRNVVSNNVNNRHPQFKSLVNYNSTQFNALKAQVKSAVLAVGTNGSDTEEGFCAAARQLFDNSTNRFFNPGDKAAIIFLTDEDDASTYKRCLSAYELNTNSAQVVYYNYMQQRTKITLEYRVNRDGIISWYPATWGIALSSPNNFSNNQNCSSQDQAAALAKINAMGYVVQNVTACTYELAQTNHYGSDLGDDGTVASKNLCTSTVTFQGQSYPNLYSFITAAGYSAQPTSCVKQTVASSSITASPNYTSVIESDTMANNAQDLKIALINKSNSLFGSGFIFASIIRKQGESCALQSGQSYGAKYEQLTSQLAQNAISESMCASSFSNVLSSVSNFMTTQAQKSYVVPNMTTEEKVLGVGIRRNGSLTTLNSSQFEAVGSTITLTNFTLMQGDIIEVSYGN